MFDLHVHAGPDILPRRAGDRQVLEWYEEAGFSGCVLKAHYDSTVGRAAAASEGLALRAYGGLALNQHVGGINPAAVAAALAMGARVIWMPTADARVPEAAGVVRLCTQHPGLTGATFAIPPVDRSTEAAVREVLGLIGDADVVLATGHLGAAEVAWLVGEARAAGITRILLTHPTFTVPGMKPAQVRELTEQGCHAEITAFQLLHQAGCDATRLAELVVAVGYDRIVLSSDAGQTDSPTPPEALRQLVDALAATGLDRQALEACAAEVPERLVSP